MDNFDQNEDTNEVDNGVLPFVSSDNSDETETIETRDDENQDEGESSSQEGEGTEGKPALTEKGTKLDPDPLSQAHQLLANERAKIASYEKVLSDPALLRKYAKESGMTLEEAKAEIKEEKKETEKSYSPDRFKTAQDVADALNELAENSNKTVSQLKEQIQSLQGELSGISSTRNLERVTNSMQSDIASVQEKYPQLNPKSPEYDKELEKEIGSFYHELDFDPQTGGYKGKFSIANITDRFMKVRGVGAKEGSARAQTIVKTKVSGQVVTSSKTSSKGASTSSDPGTSIAQKIQNALKNN